MKKNLFEMMGKNSLLLLSAIMMTVFSMGLTACSDDDDAKTNLETPKYESYSAHYDVTSTDSDIKYIELTASGNYIIQKKGYYSRANNEKAGKKNIFLSPLQPTRATYGDIIYGKYTKVSDTEFLLEGYGTIKIGGSSDDAQTLEITPTGGETFTLPVEKHDEKASSTWTNNICRTWSIASLGINITLDGKSIFNKEYKMNELKNFGKDFAEVAKKYAYLDDDDDEDYEDYDDDEDFDDFGFDDDETPDQVIFTKAGTYMVLYTNQKLAVATWVWENESEGLLRYSWDYDNLYSSWGSGTVSLGFRGNQLTIKETLSDTEEDDDDDDVPSDIIVTYYLNEVK